VDGNRNILGTITDGDVRRCLIRHCDLNTLIENVMNKSPITASIDDSSPDIVRLMEVNDIYFVPILDGKRVVGIQSLKDSVAFNKKKNLVFLMAGGFGTRLKPLTDHTPKPLLKVGGMPILEIIINQFKKYGFINFVISVHYKSEMICEYFKDGSWLGVNIQYVYETLPLGTAGSLGLLQKELIEGPIIVMNGDILTDVNFEHLLNYHVQSNVDATMCVREYDFQVPFGVIESKEALITKIIEKPTHTFFVNAGIYVLSDLIVKLIGDEHIDMTTFLGECMENKRDINMFPIHEYWLDIGRTEEYNKANLELPHVKLN
jgi:NDP-sugar pyrophosphorylase family protein